MVNRGRCPVCKMTDQLRKAGAMTGHRNKLGEPCEGSGRMPIDPATDTTPDNRDQQTYYDAVRQLERLAGKPFLTEKDRADRERLRRIRDESAQGSNRERRIA